MFKTYNEPEFTVLKADTNDVITTSAGAVIHQPNAFTDWETRTFSSYGFNF